MQTTLELLDAVKIKTGIKSDYALAPIIGLTRAAINTYRKGRVRMGDETALRVAEILEIPPAYVFAVAHAERASDESAREVWQELAKKLHHAAPILAGVAVLIGALPFVNSVECILCKIAAQFKTRSKAFFLPA